MALSTKFFPRKLGQVGCLLLLSIAGVGLTTACNVQADKNRYILAERLFNDRKYVAALDEFGKIVESNPRNSLAQQALYRMGVIQFLYLNRYADAIKSFRQFSLLSQSEELVYEAEKNIGEIYFSKTEQFRLAAEQYQRLLDKFPKAKERDFFLYRVAKSYYGALDFSKAIKTYQELIKRHPKSTYAVESYYQIGNTYFTEGSCDKAIKAFNEVVKHYPNNPQAIFAQFGIGNCYEEQGHLEDALEMYSKILEKHPSKNVVQAKIQRLKLLQEKQIQLR